MRLEGYSGFMVGLVSKMAGGCLVLVLALSSLAGLVCAEGPDDSQAMECCRGDAHHCNMPEKTEDCCKPDRSPQNPASVESSGQSSIDIESAPDAAVLAAVVTAPDTGYRVISFSSSRAGRRPRSSPIRAQCARASGARHQGVGVRGARSTTGASSTARGDQGPRGGGPSTREGFLPRLRGDDLVQFQVE